MFDIAHVAWTADDTPVEAAFHVMPCHFWTLRFDWDDPKLPGDETVSNR